MTKIWVTICLCYLCGTRETVNTQLRLSRLERGVEKAEAFSRVTLLHMGTLSQCTALKEGQSDYVTPVHTFKKKGRVTMSPLCLVSEDPVLPIRTWETDV